MSSHLATIGQVLLLRSNAGSVPWARSVYKKEVIEHSRRMYKARRCFHAVWSYSTHTDSQLRYLIQVTLGVLLSEALVPPLLIVTAYWWMHSDWGQQCRAPTAFPIAGIIYLPRVRCGVFTTPQEAQPTRCGTQQKDHCRISITNCWVTPV